MPSSTAVPFVIPPPMEVSRCQLSTDAEAIKIVIHKVESDPICSSKERIVLGKDPRDKAHRSKFFLYKMKNIYLLMLHCLILTLQCFFPKTLFLWVHIPAIPLLCVICVFTRTILCLWKFQYVSVC